MDWYQGKREGIGKDEGGRIWWKYYVFMYENGAMKPVETILEMGEKE
jgi:hypothetical protein